ncbi:hypothetical protein GH714_011085 [Hevea brasiliensis]|uniref:B box-type domain-containing protein n=1 Tax=Hevea brasiliensis TaxID=3981 RepID=A0A6A6KBJ7_HEVBR|nr:hypothetical protein GH714_011085 [Hevea brasiliensis]
MMQITLLIQETAGFFFCLEDRALLCRKCDAAIHTANAYVSAHQRFLLTGVKRGTPLPLTSPCNRVFACTGWQTGFEPYKVSFSSGSAAGGIPEWQIDEFLGLTDNSQNYGYKDNGSSKVDSGKGGDSDSSGILRSAEEEVDDDECQGQVPDSSWAVPQMPSPPTAQGYLAKTCPESI